MMRACVGWAGMGTAVGGGCWMGGVVGGRRPERGWARGGGGDQAYVLGIGERAERRVRMRCRAKETRGWERRWAMDGWGHEMRMGWSVRGRGVARVGRQTRGRGDGGDAVCMRTRAESGMRRE